MTGIAIYMEGGGDSTESRAAIRRGMGEFLREIRDQARARGLTWKVVACGGRVTARDKFTNAMATAPEMFNVLLVDSEAPVDRTPRMHLHTRDGWDLVGDDERFHLMVQTMETWLVADVHALKQFYKQAFVETALPQADDLETVAKRDVAQALARATRNTQKGEYHKVHHASELLARVDPANAVRRCRHCRRLFGVLTDMLRRDRR